MTRNELQGRLQELQSYQETHTKRQQEAKRVFDESQRILNHLDGALGETQNWLSKLDAADKAETERAEAEKARAEQERQGRRRKRQGNGEQASDGATPEAEEPPAVCQRIGPETVDPVPA